jgi:hypothetical protein
MILAALTIVAAGTCDNNLSVSLDCNGRRSELVIDARIGKAAASERLIGRPIALEPHHGYFVAGDISGKHGADTASNNDHSVWGECDHWGRIVNHVVVGKQNDPREPGLAEARVGLAVG